MTPIFACPLLHRGVLAISGDDRHGFLQGLISNDINLCQPENPIYAAFLTPQGKFLHDMFIVNSGEYFLIDCEAERAEDLLKRLKLYKLRAKVTLENATDHYAVWVLWGDSMPVLQGLYKDPRLAALGSRLITRKDFTFDRALTDFAAYDRHRLSLGIPDGSRDMIVEKSTLLECNMDKLNAISWSKGCYMGQELTARMHYRALIKKRLYPVSFRGNPPPPGTDITLNDEVIGEMRSSYDNIGLALLNIEGTRSALKNRAQILCSGISIIPTIPTWIMA